MTAKQILALSGFVMLLYVLAHMGANLLAFAGPATFNGYAAAVHDMAGGLALLVVRVVLAIAFIAHGGAHAWLLFHPLPVQDEVDDAPRTPAYVENAFPPLVSGAVIMIFIVLHLAQLTFGASLRSFDPATPYDNLVTALRTWPVTIGYVLAAFALGAHLLPGTWSALHTLRWIDVRRERSARVLSPLVAAVVALGLSSVPLAVALGAVSSAKL